MDRDHDEMSRDQPQVPSMEVADKSILGQLEAHTSIFGSNRGPAIEAHDHNHHRIIAR